MSRTEKALLDSLLGTEVSDMDAKALVHNALNEVLNTEYDWQQMADENLFSLGMDPWLFADLSTKLQDALKSPRRFPLQPNLYSFNRRCE